MRAAAEAHDHEPLHRPRLALVVIGGLAAIVAIALAALPREHAELPAIAHEALEVALPGWHTNEPVNEIVYGTRGLDTFGETFLLLAAVVSVVVLTRGRERRSGFIGEALAAREEQHRDAVRDRVDATEQLVRDTELHEWGRAHRRRRTPDHEPVGGRGAETAEQMTVVVRVAVRLVAPLLLIAGMYLVGEGYSPGGGFPAGAVLLGVVLLVYAAFGYTTVRPLVMPARLELAELGGAMGIVGVELLGLFLSGSVSAGWAPFGPTQSLRSGGVLQLFSVGELVEVATGLIIVMFALMTMGHEWAPDASPQPAGAGARAARRRPRT